MGKKVFNLGLVLFLACGLVLGNVINVPGDQASIQAGIDMSTNGDTVLVAEGIYSENINFKGKSITVGSLFLVDSDDTHIQNTIIDGGASGHVVKFSSGESSSSILIGFTIRNGKDDYGGGIFCSNSSPRISNVMIHSNVSEYSGGGIHCYSSNPILERVVIYDNETSGDGGGICCFNNSNLTLRNVTIAKNIAYSDGNEIACQYASKIEIVNSIIWSEYSPNPIYIEGSGIISATYSDIKNGSGESYFGEGCIDTAPLFTDYNGNDFHLRYDSPAIDTGDPDLDNDGVSWLDDPDDQDPDGTRLDMGAYYFVQTGIQGVITINGGTGSVEDATVTATLTTGPSEQFTTTPDEDGKYFLELASGNYDVTVALEGYTPDPEVRNIDILGQLVRNVDFTLNAPPPGSVIGNVTLEGIEDITWCTVTATNIATGYSNSSHPDEYGNYIISSLPAGAYSVTASLEGYKSITDTVSVTSGAPTTVNFHLEYIKVEGTISGKVSLKVPGGSLTDVEISVSGSDTTYDFIGVVNDTGYYEVNVLQGTYNVTASLDGYAPVTISDVQVVALNVTSGVNMRLVNWSTITGTEFNTALFTVVSFEGNFFIKSESNQLAAFGSGGTNDCRGIATWIEGNHPFWNNYWDINGYWYLTIVSNNNSGSDTISFKIFDTKTDSIYECNEKIIFSDCQYDATVLTIDGAIKEQKLDLIDNWNWVSFYLSPSETSIDSIFSDLTDASSIYQVKTQSKSATYIGGNWVGDLTDIKNSDGYLIKMTDSFDSFTFYGQSINPVINPITLLQGWNWIGYYPQRALPLSTALESIIARDTIIVKNQTQSALYIGDNWIGDLTQMEPGIGYKLKITTDDSLTYPLVSGALSKPLTQKELVSNLAGWNVIPGTKSNMIAFVQPEINDEKVTDSEKYSIGIFDSCGNCRSIGKKEKNFWYFTIVGNEDEESLYFKIWDAKKE